MFKKIIISLLMISIFASLPVFAIGNATPPIELANETENVAQERVISFADGKISVTTNDGKKISPIISLDTSGRYNIPDEILEKPTQELFEYFMSSVYMSEAFVSKWLSSSSETATERDFSYNKAFAELLKRNDFINVLTTYAKNIKNGTVKNEDDIKKFNMILRQPTLTSLLDNSISSTQNELRTNSDYEADGITYMLALEVTTADNDPDNKIALYRASRNLTRLEIANFNSQLAFAFPNNTRLYEPNSKYNCHSYAWYMYSPGNPYWLDDINPFRNDSHLQSIEETALLQENDILVYVDENDRILHSAIFKEVTDSGDVMVISKWGMAGVYLHERDDVPAEYRAAPNSQRTFVYAFRYHDYDTVYTHNHYHSGTKHYFEYTGTCSICGKTTSGWKSVFCPNPNNCLLPWAIPNEDEEY